LPEASRRFRQTGRPPCQPFYDAAVTGPAVVTLVPVVLLLVLLLVLLAAVLRATRKPVNLQVTVADDALHVRFLGWDAFWLLQREVVVPIAQVRGVTVARLDAVPREGVKLPGAGVPGLIRAGIWRAGPDRDVWDVRQAEHVLWIELEPGADYRRLILEVPDPHAAALELRPVLGSFLPEPY
jgi:hypothetical protein